MFFLTIDRSDGAPRASIWQNLSPIFSIGYTLRIPARRFGCTKMGRMPHRNLISRRPPAAQNYETNPRLITPGVSQGTFRSPSHPPGRACPQPPPSYSHSKSAFICYCRTNYETNPSIADGGGRPTRPILPNPDCKGGDSHSLQKITKRTQDLFRRLTPITKNCETNPRIH